MTTEYWIAFLSAAFLINITPGPDILFILSKSSRSGRWTALWGALGLWAAALTHVSAVAIGLSAIIFSSQTLFMLIKYIGAIYLIWLGVKLFFSDQNLFIPNHTKENNIKTFFSGFLVNISNPKAALFFMAFLPAFIHGETEHPQIQLFILGVLVIVVKIMTELLLIFFSGYAAKFLSQYKHSGSVMNKISSAFFIGFGLQLLILKRA